MRQDGINHVGISDQKAKRARRVPPPPAAALLDEDTRAIDALLHEADAECVVAVEAAHW